MEVSHEGHPCTYVLTSAEDLLRYRNRRRGSTMGTDHPAEASRVADHVISAASLRARGLHGLHDCSGDSQRPPPLVRRLWHQGPAATRRSNSPLLLPRFR